MFCDKGEKALRSFQRNFKKMLKKGLANADKMVNIQGKNELREAVHEKSKPLDRR
jgi:hypothetical protein